VTRERQLGLGVEDAGAVVGRRIGRREQKRRLRQVRPPGEALHLVARQPAAVQDDRERVAEPGLGREHVDLCERAIHGRESAMAR
jgi:hypothetical protein